MSGDPNAWALAGRVAERLLIVLVAFACVAFGYRLFSIVPTQDSAGEIRLPSLQIVLSKIGPGVLFAAFGAVVLWKAVETQFVLRPPPGGRDTQPSLSYEVPPAAEPADQAVATLNAQRTAGVLNCLRAGPAADAIGTDRTTDAIDRAKIATLIALWDPAWGDASVRDAFRRTGTPPDGPLRTIFTTVDRNCPSPG